MVEISHTIGPYEADIILGFDHVSLTLKHKYYIFIRDIVVEYNLQKLTLHEEDIILSFYLAECSCIRIMLLYCVEQKLNIGRKLNILLLFSKMVARSGDAGGDDGRGGFFFFRRTLHSGGTRVLYSRIVYCIYNK